MSTSDKQLLSALSFLGFIAIWYELNFFKALLITIACLMCILGIRYFTNKNILSDQSSRNNLYLLIIIISSLIIILFIETHFLRLRFNYWSTILASNIVTFFIMLFDKVQAYSDKWRVPDKYLFMLGILSAGVSPIIASSMFSHKNWKEHFIFRNFAFLGMHIVLLILYYYL